MKQLQGKDLKFGDVVFIDGRSNWNIFGKMIRFIENGGKHPTDKFMPNHVGLIIEPHVDIRECKIIQAGFGGVKIQALNMWTNHSKTNVIIKRCNRTRFVRRQKELRKWLLGQVGKKYDYPALMGLLIRWVLLQSIESRIIRFIVARMKNPLSSRIKFTCSELIARAFLEVVKIYIFKKVHPSNITPYDEYRSKKLKTVAKIMNFEYEK